MILRKIRSVKRFNVIRLFAFCFRYDFLSHASNFFGVMQLMMSLAVACARCAVSTPKSSWSRSSMPCASVLIAIFAPCRIAA